MKRARSVRGAAGLRWLLGAGAAVAVGLLVASTNTCLRTGFAWGLWVDECPDGEVRALVRVDADGLSRGTWRPLSVSLVAAYTTGDGDEVHEVPLSRFTPTVALVGPKGETALEPQKGWSQEGERQLAMVQLPAVTDGEYTLRVRAHGGPGEASVDVPLPLFTPARVHTLTDRPLYEPGDVVRFRAVALKASDLTPLDERPGVWEVRSPSGELLLEEKSPAGAWGVASGDFPLDAAAASGSWTVTWVSGQARGDRRFEVRPFTLPRFTVEAGPARPWYRRGEKPVLQGVVRYASGAPVAGAVVSVRWRTGGDWPPPTDWVNGSALPARATSRPDGAFTLDLPEVPHDLVGQAQLRASLSVVDAAGDRVEGAAVVLLSEDDIAVSAVTELGGGLVEGFNNRLFVRATTPDGRVLRDVTLRVRRLWEAGDEGISATVDEDGVGLVQIDPGAAVNVVVPALPWRAPPPRPKVVRQQLVDLLGARRARTGVSLADRLVFDRAEAALADCALYASPPTSAAMVAVLVRAQGGAAQVSPGAGPLGRCVEGVLRGLRFGPGEERFLSGTWSFDDSQWPRMTVRVTGVPEAPDDLEAALETALLPARRCLPATSADAMLPRFVQWRVDEAHRLTTTWAPTGERGLSEATMNCIQGAMGAVRLEPKEMKSTPAIGTALIEVRRAGVIDAQPPRDTVMLGYELEVSAQRGDAPVGKTRLRLAPGQVPERRLRASTQVLRPGDEFTVELFRGPDFEGELPKELPLRLGDVEVTAPVLETSRQARFKVPEGWQGWASVGWGDAQVYLFIRPAAPLEVTVTAEKPRYAPGQLARLDVQTSEGGHGAPAAVGLFGVDDGLAQLTRLPGPDELSSLRPTPSGAPAFPGLDLQALALGRVRGANAAAATLLRVSSLPAAAELEAPVRVSGVTAFDPNAVLVDHFYGALGELYAQERRWEASAPPAEKLTPAVMARLWAQALDAVAARGDDVTDAWARRLRLHRLPADLLALTDPRSVVGDGTRLPEDLQSWPAWVAKEKP